MKSRKTAASTIVADLVFLAIWVILELQKIGGAMQTDSTVVAALIALVGVLLGWALGHLSQPVLARRQEARDLANTRRDLHTKFLTIARETLNHLAEGALNRINGAVPKGAYAGRLLDDHTTVRRISGAIRRDLET